MIQVTQPQTETDEALMLEYGKGDMAAFTELYARHKGPLYRYICRQLSVKQQNKAQELFQEVWVSVIDSRSTYTVDAKFTTWLYRIAHNLLVDEHRKSHVRGEQLSLVGEVQSDVEVALEQRGHDDTTDNDFLKQALKQCVELLVPQQRDAFLLRHEAGFEPGQVSEIVGAKPETVKTRLRYAMSHLRGCLQRKVGSNDMGASQKHE